MDRMQRTRQTKLPPHTLCVTRGTLFGNDYKIGDGITRKDAVERFRVHIKSPLQTWKVKAFIERCEKEGIEHLACWCKLNELCHADIWLDIWNEYRAAAEEAHRAAHRNEPLA